MSYQHDYPKIRLYVEHGLTPGALVEIAGKQAHYLLHVMRVKEGAAIGLFNGRDGEWLGHVSGIHKKHLSVMLGKQLRAQASPPDIWLAFAPIKHSDVIVEKATELGVSSLQPVMTQHTIIGKVNQEKMQAHAVEAAEQSERLDVPVIREPVKLRELLSAWPKDRALVYGDESGGGETAKEVLASLKHTKFAALTGPEGGFAEEELALLRAHPQAFGVGLGPRILKADTAALTLTALLFSQFGDWQQKPSFRAGA